MLKQKEKRIEKLEDLLELPEKKENISRAERIKRIHELDLTVYNRMKDSGEHMNLANNKNWFDLTVAKISGLSKKGYNKIIKEIKEKRKGKK